MFNLLQIATFNQFQPQTIIWFVVLLVLLWISAMVSGSETACFSLSPGDMEKIEKGHSNADKALLRLLSMQDYLLATILLINNLVNICIVLLANEIIDHIVTFAAGSAWEFVVKTIIVTFILLLFGEIMPKVYSTYNALKFARRMARPLLALKHLMKPFAWVLINSGNMVNNHLNGKKENLSIDQLSKAIEMTGDHSEEERQMLSGIVGFVNTEVTNIMKLRIDIVSLDMEADFAEVKKVIIESGFSRIPVWEENIDNIKGILYVKDMLPFIGQNDDFNWRPYLRPAYFVPEHKKINDLMEEFQSEKVHIAIVVDEYGSTLGLVSLEDILEEIVGEITDESDIESPTFYQKIDEYNYVFEGKTLVADLEKVLGFDEEYFAAVRHGAETIAGLMLEIKCDFLKKDESVSARGVRFTVVALDGRRIDKVRVNIKDAEKPQKNE